MKQIDIEIPEIIKNNFILVPIPPNNENAHETDIVKMEILELIAKFRNWKPTIFRTFENETFTGTIEEFQAINGDKILLIKEITENENVFNFTYNITKEVPNIYAQEFGMSKIGLMLKQLFIDATLWKVNQIYIVPIQDDAINQRNQIIEQTKERLSSLDNLKLT